MQENQKPIGGQIAPSSYRRDIDGLRAVAVMAVLIFHAFPQLLSGGFVGVDVFFVISGYLITRLLIQHAGHRNYLFTFYLARARRIFPALVVVLLSCLVAGWHLMGTQDFERLREHVVGGAAFVSNILLAGELDYFRQSNLATPLLHLWSLAIEEQFYLLWPVALWLILRTRHSSRFLLAIMLASLAYSTHMVMEAPPRAFYSSPGRWWELMIGAFVAYEETRGTPIWIRAQAWVKALVSAVGLVLIGTATFLLTPDSFFPGLTALWPTLGAAMVICGANSRLLESKIAVFLGKISYPLYLWHWPLIAFISQESVTPITAMEMIAILLLSVVLATATYWFVETPIRKRAANALLPVAASVSLISICLASAFLVLPNPHQNRLDQVQALHAQGRMPTSWRKEECFLTDATAVASFESCKVGGSAVAIWGDSHAAALYPGMLEQGRKTAVNVALFAVAGCPPIPVSDLPRCGAKQAAALTQIKLMRPQVVVVHAHWGHYKTPDLAANAVRALRAAGVPTIVVVGSVPHWYKAPHFIIGAHLRKTGDAPPQRMSGLMKAPPPGLEALISRSVVEAGGTYLSAEDQLCNNAGCLAWTGHEGATMLYWDAHHLSEAGSLLLARAFSATIFNGARPLRPN